MNWLESSGVLQQTRAVEREGDGARAVVAVGDERPVAAAVDIRAADDLFAAQMICFTARGAFSGAAARPSTISACCPGRAGAGGRWRTVPASAPPATRRDRRLRDVGHDRAVSRLR